MMKTPMRNFNAKLSRETSTRNFREKLQDEDSHERYFLDTGSRMETWARSGAMVCPKGLDKRHNTSNG